MSLDARRAPHPVQFEVEYPERLSRLLIFFKFFLIIPHMIVVYFLALAAAILGFLAWFAILFTGRYPKAFHDFTSGIVRWQTNIAVYFYLMRDEYPPFSWEPGQYPAALTIPLAERQSRLRLFVRWFTIMPNAIVFFFVSIAWSFTTFIAWWAILFTGRYPEGLFRFGVGVLRWQVRQTSYTTLLRDEYPPYSLRADARPGNEVVSGIIGLPFGVAYVAAYVLLFLAPIFSGPERVTVDAALLEDPAALERAAPTGKVGSLRVTLIGYDDSARLPLGASSDRPVGYEDAHLESFTVRAERDGWAPVFYSPFFFVAYPCFGGAATIASGATMEDNQWFHLWVFGGDTESTVYFWVDGDTMCQFSYFGTGVPLRFDFE